MIIFSVIVFILVTLWTVFSGWLIHQHTDKIDELEQANKKLTNDINSLHKNQVLISSSFKELHRIIRKYDKNAKIQYRIDNRNQT